MKKAMIAAGGTGGHIFPAVAIAKAIGSRDGSVEIVFAGTRRGLEERVYGSLGMRFVAVRSSKFKGVGTLNKMLSIMNIPISIVSSMGIVMSERPSLLISIGGYAAGPLSAAAWLMRVPIILVEPNAVPGLTNRIVGRFARKVFVAYDGMSKFFDPRKIVRSGVPVRSEILAVRRAEIGIGDRIAIFVFGGSQGAMRLNESIVEAAAQLSDIRDKFCIIHQTGRNADVSALSDAYRRAGVNASVFEFSDRIWECYAKADLVISRSGAGTVAELAALAIPCVLVPYPYAADDHQRANAMALVRTGGAMMLDDSECTGERFAEIIRDVIQNPDALIRMRKLLIGSSLPDAAGKIAEESLEFMT